MGSSAKKEVYHIGPNKMWVVDNIIHAVLEGPMTEPMAIKWTEVVREWNRNNPAVNRAIIDLNRAGKPDSKAIKILRQLNDDPVETRAALTGLNPVARIIANFFIGTLKNKQIRFFKDREKALAWLKAK